MNFAGTGLRSAQNKHGMTEKFAGTCINNRQYDLEARPKNLKHTSSREDMLQPMFEDEPPTLHHWERKRQSSSNHHAREASENQAS